MIETVFKVFLFLHDLFPFPGSPPTRTIFSLLKAMGTHLFLLQIFRVNV